jgi:hypothetical protein
LPAGIGFDQTTSRRVPDSETRAEFSRPMTLTEFRPIVTPGQTSGSTRSILGDQP